MGGQKGYSGKSYISRRSFLTGTMALAVASLSSCRGIGTGSDGRDQSTSESDKTVRIALAGKDGDTNLIELGGIAQKEGFIEEELRNEGYAPEYLNFTQSGPAINEAFSAGSIDLAEYGDLPAYTAITQGVGIKAIANANSRFGFGIMVGNDSGLDKVEDLKGKKVVVGFGTVMHNYLLKALTRAGVSPSDVELVNSVTDGPSMIASGQADAYSEALVGLYPVEKKGVGKIIATSREDPSLSSAVLLYGRTDYLSKNRAVGVAMLKAFKRAYEIALNDPEKARNDLVTDRLSADLASKLYEDSDFKAFNPEIGDEVRGKFEAVAKFELDNKLISKTVSVDDVVDPTFYEEA